MTVITSYTGVSFTSRDKLGVGSVSGPQVEKEVDTDMHCVVTHPTSPCRRAQNRKRSQDSLPPSRCSIPPNDYPIRPVRSSCGRVGVDKRRRPAGLWPSPPPLAEQTARRQNGGYVEPQKNVSWRSGWKVGFRSSKACLFRGAKGDCTAGEPGLPRTGFSGATLIVVRLLGQGSLAVKAPESRSLTWPDLAVEVLSEGNTKPEMARKVREYFDAGVTLVWLIDPRKRTARVFSTNEKSVLVRAHQASTAVRSCPASSFPSQTC